MFSYTTKDGLLTVTEAFNGWYITHNSTDTTRGMGDSYFFNEDDDGNLVQTSQADMEHSIEIDKWELIAAYFPEHEREHNCPICGQRWEFHDYCCDDD